MTMRAIDLNELLVFVRVATRKSFSRAARDLGVPSSTVSRKIASLEGRLGVQLIERSTRHVRITALGAVYQEHCERALAAAEEGERTLRHLDESPKGTLRVTAPYDFGESALRPIVERYIARFPDVTFELWLTDEVVDLVAQRVDIAFRFGISPGLGTVARVFGTAPNALCAAPSYLAERSPPRAVADLTRHPLLLVAHSLAPHTLRFEEAGEAVHLAVAPRVVINSHPLLRAVCLQGRGIAVIPSYYVDDDLEHGRLVRLLPKTTVPTLKIMVVRPEGVKATRSVRAFMDLTREHFEREGLVPKRG